MKWDIFEEVGTAIEKAKGRGHWGHKGRPGKRGGSLPSKGVQSISGIREKLRDSLSGRKWPSIDKAEKELERVLQPMGVESERRGQGRYKVGLPNIGGGVYMRLRETRPMRHPRERVATKDYYWELKNFGSERDAASWFEH